jgi:GT2 family glycosyltransferase
MAKISVHIVTWNSMKVLSGALDSLREQSFKDFSLVVVDNASTDGSVNCVRERFPEATVIRNFKNLGFSAAHNQAIEMARKAKAKYVLVMNPDIILTPDHLRNLLAGLEGRPEIGSAGGKLLRVRAGAGENADPELTDVFDSIGLGVRKNRRFYDRASGETDAGQYDKPLEVFGVSGALVLYRLEALDEAQAAVGEAFDEDFFAYKEDADLAWRLRILGWRAAYVPAAVAYHYRGAGGAEKIGAWQALLGRRSRSVMVNRLSTRNHLLLLAKNDYWSNALLYAPLTFFYELAKFLGVLLFQPRVLPAYLSVLPKLPKMWRKRRRLMRHGKAPAAEIRKWFK